MTGAARSPRATTAEHSSRERDSPLSHAPAVVHKKQQTPQLSARAEALVPKLKLASASTLSVEALCWWPWWGSFWSRLTTTTRDRERHPAHRDGRISASKRGVPVVGGRHGADQIALPLGVKFSGPHPLSGPQGKCRKSLLRTNPFLDPRSGHFSGLPDKKTCFLQNPVFGAHFMPVFCPHPVWRWTDQVPKCVRARATTYLQA